MRLLVNDCLAFHLLPSVFCTQLEAARLTETTAVTGYPTSSPQPLSSVLISNFKPLIRQVPGCSKLSFASDCGKRDHVGRVFYRDGQLSMEEHGQLIPWMFSVVFLTRRVWAR